MAATALMETPHTLDLGQWVKHGVEGKVYTRLCEFNIPWGVVTFLHDFALETGLSSVEEVATGVEHILADMIAKDPETLTHVKTL